MSVLFIPLLFVVLLESDHQSFQNVCLQLEELQCSDYLTYKGKIPRKKKSPLEFGVQGSRS